MLKKPRTVEEIRAKIAKMRDTWLWKAQKYDEIYGDCAQELYYLLTFIDGKEDGKRE